MSQDKKEKKVREITRDNIRNALSKGLHTPGEILHFLGQDGKGTGLNYWLDKMEKSKEIVREKRGFYSIVEKEITVEEQKILDIIESNDCKPIKMDKMIEKSKISKEKLLEIIPNLSRNGISFYEDHFDLFPKKLNELKRCAICYDKFEINQLIISEFASDGYDFVSNIRIHATCKKRLHMLWGGIDDDTVCDYCGLSLSVSSLKHVLRQDINVDKEIDQLFCKPFSKLFSAIKTTNWSKDAHDLDYYQSTLISESGSTEDIPVFSFAHYEEEDGKRFHPYCLEEYKKQPKPKKKNDGGKS